MLIILQNHILQNIVSSAPSSPQYKYAVNSTIIQHLSDPSPTSTSQTTQTHSSAPATQLAANEADLRDADVPIRGGASDERSSGERSNGAQPTKGRRGLHSAIGAYWNNETDGMWSYKFEGGDKSGMDVVISVIWVAV